MTSRFTNHGRDLGLCMLASPRLFPPRICHGPDKAGKPPSYNLERVHEPRYRILQICRQHVGRATTSLTLGTNHRVSHRILFQREVYPSDDFHMVKKYGQTLLVTQDLALENYLERYVASFTRGNKKAHGYLQNSHSSQ
jgi:hypothetical protein